MIIKSYLWMVLQSKPVVSAKEVERLVELNDVRWEEHIVTHGEALTSVDIPRT